MFETLVRLSFSVVDSRARLPVGGIGFLQHDDGTGFERVRAIGTGAVWSSVHGHWIASVVIASNLVFFVHVCCALAHSNDADKEVNFNLLSTCCYCCTVQEIASSGLNESVLER